MPSSPHWGRGVGKVQRLWLQAWHCLPGTAPPLPASSFPTGQTSPGADQRPFMGKCSSPSAKSYSSLKRIPSSGNLLALIWRLQVHQIPIRVPALGLSTGRTIKREDRTVGLGTNIHLLSVPPTPGFSRHWTSFSSLAPHKISIKGSILQMRK